MKQLASQSRARLEAFQYWFDQWAEGLWSFAHFYALSSDEHQDDFLDVLHAARPKISKSLLVDSNGRRGVGIFLEAWFTRLRKNRQHSSQNSVSLSWEDQFLLFAIFRMNWSDELVAEFVRLPLSAIKFRLFTALCKESKIPDEELAHISRDCSRFDLYFGDLLLDQKWKDPLNIVNRAEIQKHGQHCTRCQLLQENLRLCVDQLRGRSIFSIPQTFRNEIREEFGTRWQLLFSGEWFSDLPWIVRVPAQVSIAGLAVWGVLFLSSKNPSFERFYKGATQVLVSGQSKAAYVWDSTRSTLSEWVDGWKSDTPVANVSESLRGSGGRPETAMLTQGKRYNEVELLKFALSKKVDVVLDTDANKTVGGDSVLLGRQEPVAGVVAGAGSASGVAGVEKSTSTADEKLFYRWSAVSKNIDADREKILAVLTKYNAVRAGDIGLGGNYQGGKYFHFSVAKEVFDVVFEEVKALGLVGLTSNEGRSGMRKTPPDQRRAVFSLMPEKDRVRSSGEAAAGGASSSTGSPATLPPAESSNSETPAVVPDIQ
jgi:hypothetical protein